MVGEFHGLKGNNRSLEEEVPIVFLQKRWAFFDALATETLVRKFHGFKGVEGSLEEVSEAVYSPQFVKVNKLGIFWHA